MLSVRYNLNPGPPLTGAGTSVKNDFATIEGTHTFQSALGTFTDEYKGTLGPLSSPRQIAEGHWKIVAATGAYAGAHASGRFTVEADGPTGTATGIHEGHVTFGP